MIDLNKTVADARYRIVTTLDTGEVIAPKARTKEAADRVYAMAQKVIGQPDWQGRVRVSVELIDSQA